MSLSRREFLEKSAALAGAAALSACSTPSEKPADSAAPAQTSKATSGAATDLVPFGKKGLKICRLGIGTGSTGGDVQRGLGQEGFTRLIHACYDRGVTFIDTADMYKTHEMVRAAIKGLPREKLWIQTKMMWDRPSPPEKPLEVLDRFRTELGVDHVDSLLLHCATQNTWDTDLRGMMDAFDEAQAKGLIRMKGLSCHGLPALERALAVDWPDMHLARINPQGRHVDGTFGKWSEPGNVPRATATIRGMHEKGRGILGMKIMGNGEFTSDADREKSVQFAMTCGYVDAIVVGLKSVEELDWVIGRMNHALAAGQG